MAQHLFTAEKKIEIVCEQMRLELSTDQVFDKYGVKKTTFLYWKRKYFPNRIDDRYEERKEMFSIKTSTELTGINKEYFLRDCFQRGWSDRKLLKNIVDLHYSIMSNRPEMQGKEMTEIKKMLTEIVKFK